MYFRSQVIYSETEHAHCINQNCSLCTLALLSTLNAEELHLSNFTLQVKVFLATLSDTLLKGDEGIDLVQLRKLAFLVDLLNL